VLFQGRTSRRTVVVAAVAVAVTAAASVEVAAFAAALTVADFTVALTAAASTAVAFVAVAFVMVAFAAVGFTIATSSSLAILGTHFFTMPIHITDTIPTGTIPTAIILMVTDTAALAAVAFAAVASAVVAFAAVDDPYNQPICQGSAGYAGQLVEQIQLRLARADYYNGSIDGVERQWNTPGGRSANISALTACQKEQSIHQAVFQKLGNKNGGIRVVWNEWKRA